MDLGIDRNEITRKHELDRVMHVSDMRSTHRVVPVPVQLLPEDRLNSESD